MTPVALDMSQIHLGKGQGASGRHQECLHSLLENRRVVSAWVPLVQCRANVLLCYCSAMVLHVVKSKLLLLGLIILGVE